MDEQLTIYFASHENVMWCRRGQQQVQHGFLQDALAEADNSDIVVVLSGESVLVTEARLPPIRQSSRRLQAVRYALEEQLASSVDSQHFALGPRTATGATAVVVVNTENLREILADFDAARERIVSVVVDVLCLPVPEENAASISLLDERAVVRHGRLQGFACELDLLNMMLPAADLKQARLDIAAQDHARQQQHVDALAAAGYQVQRLTDTGAADWLGQVTSHSGINLLQGAFAPSNAMDDAWRPLRATAVLAGTWLLLALVSQMVHYFQLSQRSAALDQLAQANFRKAFPQVQTINDIRVQAEQELRALRGSGSASGIFPLLGATAIATGAAPGLEVQSLQYRDGGLSLSLRGKDIQALEDLRTSFASQPEASLEVESADAASEGVQIRALITGAGA